MLLSELIRYFNGHDTPEACALFAENKRVVARYDGLHLGSSFQPIFHLDRQAAVGHEAFLCIGGAHCRPMLPEEAFALAAAPDSVVCFDRLCRTLHTLNFLAQQQHAGGYLYLNVHPRHLLAVPSQHGLIFEAILKRCGLGPEDIVLELDAAGIGNDKRLLDAIEAYRLRDYRIALDRFGADPADEERLAQLRPDVIKLNRDLPLLADPGAYARLVRAGHAIGATVVAQGIETPEALAAAQAAGADLAQGFLLGRPQPDCVATHEHRSHSVHAVPSPNGAHP